MKSPPADSTWLLTEKVGGAMVMSPLPSQPRVSAVLNCRETSVVAPSSTMIGAVIRKGWVSEPLAYQEVEPGGVASAVAKLTVT